MTKPTLLLNVGTAWSASSPLHYTLCLDHKYAHTGVCKENWYLYNLHENTNKQFRASRRFKASNISSKHPDTIDEHNWRILEGKRSIDTYIEYYKSLWEHVKSDYAAVADFCNLNIILPEEFLQSIKDKLLDNFDVKVTMIFRDPIRRLFSSSNINLIVNNNPIDTIKHCVQYSGIEPNSQYSEIYCKYKKVFGEDKVHVIVMEELWSDPNKLIELSDFLNFPLTKLHENVYYPEMGVKAPHYDYLKDQWESEKVHLDEETYNYCFEHMDHVYSNFAKTFGRMPVTWGEYIQTPI